MFGLCGLHCLIFACNGLIRLPIAMCNSTTSANGKIHVTITQEITDGEKKLNSQTTQQGNISESSNTVVNAEIYSTSRDISVYTTVKSTANQNTENNAVGTKRSDNNITTLGQSYFICKTCGTADSEKCENGYNKTLKESQYPVKIIWMDSYRPYRNWIQLEGCFPYEGKSGLSFNITSNMQINECVGNCLTFNTDIVNIGLQSSKEGVKCVCFLPETQIASTEIGCELIPCPNGTGVSCGSSNNTLAVYRRGFINKSNFYCVTAPDFGRFITIEKTCADRLPYLCQAESKQISNEFPQQLLKYCKEQCEDVFDISHLPSAGMSWVGLFACKESYWTDKPFKISVASCIETEMPYDRLLITGETTSLSSPDKLTQAPDIQDIICSDEYCVTVIGATSALVVCCIVVALFMVCFCCRQKTSKTTSEDVPLNEVSGPIDSTCSNVRDGVYSMALPLRVSTGVKNQKINDTEYIGLNHTLRNPRDENEQVIYDKARPQIIPCDKFLGSEYDSVAVLKENINSNNLT